MDQEEEELKRQQQQQQQREQVRLDNMFDLACSRNLIDCHYFAPLRREMCESNQSLHRSSLDHSHRRRVSNQGLRRSRIHRHRCLLGTLLVLIISDIIHLSFISGEGRDDRHFPGEGAADGAMVPGGNPKVREESNSVKTARNGNIKERDYVRIDSDISTYVYIQYV